MDKTMAPGATDSGLSRMQFLASAVGVAAVMPDKAQGSVTIGVPAVSEPLACLSLSFTGTLDASGQMSFPHTLGALLPANILSVSAFIKLPDGKVRDISVQYVDNSSIAVAGGVPNASVKVGVVYSKDGESW